tara:strand:- start:43 stop:210 length:168 start_codon:yes stop_codon:yes gene_type:complete
MFKKKKNNSLERRVTQHFRDNTGKQYNYKEVLGAFDIKDTKTRDEIIINFKSSDS